MASGFYSIRNGVNDIGIKRNNSAHTIGFSNPTMARKVIYNIDPFKEITYLSGVNRICDNICIDVNARIIIPKINRDTFDSIFDSNLHLVQYTEQEYIASLELNHTLVMPTTLIFEDDDDFIFNVFSINKIC
jgi:hypothetical protein